MSAKLGEILVRENLITSQQLRETLEYQRANGGRLGSNLVKLGYVSDDVVTAWAALQVCPLPQRALDLGCGLGSVLLHLAWSVPGAVLDGIEVQDVS